MAGPLEEDGDAFEFAAFEEAEVAEFEGGDDQEGAQAEGHVGGQREDILDTVWAEHADAAFVFDEEIDHRGKVFVGGADGDDAVACRRPRLAAVAARPGRRLAATLDASSGAGLTWAPVAVFEML